MFNLFNFFKMKETEPIRTIIAIHGFGRKKTEYFIPFKAYFENLGYNFVNPVLYDQLDENDNQPEEWIKRAENCVSEHIQRGDIVTLIGFSMGGVIASSIASKMPVNKLILLAPAFNYVNINTAVEVVAKLVDRAPTISADDVFAPLPDSFTNTFMTVVETLKADINQVECPILIFHGNEDKVISLSSSERIFRKIQNENRALIILHGADHNLYKKEIHCKIMEELILDFITDKLTSSDSVAL